MRYLDAVNEAVLSPPPETRPALLTADAVDQALAMRSHFSDGTFESVFGTLNAYDLSPEDRRLLEQRVFGGMAVRLAVGLEYVECTTGQPARPVFGKQARTELLGEAAETYAENIAQQLDERNEGLTAVLSPDTPEWLHAADPVKVPHRFVRRLVYEGRRKDQSLRQRAIRFGQYMGFGSVLPELAEAPVGRNDAVLVQAFGRNNFPDKELPKVRRWRDEAGNDLEMWERLSEERFDPGTSNEALAKKVREMMEMSGQVVEPVAQWEVAYALWELDPDFYKRHANYFHTLWPRPESDFYPTYEVKRDSVAVMDEIGLYAPAELAHPRMLIRALGILAKLGVSADPIVADIPFDRNSVQMQIRGPLRWLLREVPTRGEHLLRGRVSF